MSSGSTTGSPRVPFYCWETDKDNYKDKIGKRVREAGKAPISGILVNQLSRNVKLEVDDDGITTEDVFPAYVKVENESCTNDDGTSGDQGHEETLSSTNRDINVTLQSSDGDSSNGSGQGSPCSCQEEIKSLKFIVSQLNQQMEKQSQAIKKQKQVVAELKTCLRNFAVSMVTCCDDDDNEGENMEGILEFSETEKTADFTDVDHELLSNPEVAAGHPKGATQTQDTFQDGENGSPIIVNCAGNYSNSVESPTALTPITSTGASSLETCSNEVVYKIIGQKTNEDETADHENFHEAVGKDSSYVHDDDESEEECDQEMEDKENYHRSSSSIKTKDGFPCVKCAKIFETKEHLRKHVRRVHHRKDSMVKCHLCPKVFKERSSLTRHFQAIHEGIRYKCVYCPGKFRGLSDVRKHENQVHKNGGQATQQCEICGIHLLNSEQSLASHMRKMHMKFTQDQKRVQSLLKERRPVQSNRRMIFECQLCSISFRKREDLLRHQSQIHGR